MAVVAQIKDLKKPGSTPTGLRFLYKTLQIDTKQQNLTDLDPRLSEFLKPNDFFYLSDLTTKIDQFVKESDIQNGNVLIHVLHTSATIWVNELDEPMLLGDLATKLRALVPKEAAYLHNGPLRTVNLCPDDFHCDRNADAHVKASLFGYASVPLIVRDGKLVLGRWQKVALVEFDGPRKREVLLQLMGV